MSLSKTLIAWISILLLCVGCKTAGPNSAPLASVVVTGNTPGQINRAIEGVFSRHSYRLVESGPANCIFEKRASLSANIAYSNWSTPITIRAKTRLVPVGEATFRIECTAVHLRDAGSTVEEQLPGCPKSGQFEKMLKEVQTSLGGGKSAN